MSALETLSGIARNPLDREPVIFIRLAETQFTSAVHLSSDSDILQRKNIAPP